MTKVVVTDTNLTNIANAIRTKGGTSELIKPSEMATAITNLPSGGILQTKSVNINDNGTQSIIADTGYEGLEQVNVTTNIQGEISGITSITIENNVTSVKDLSLPYVTNASYLFQNHTSLITTSNLTFSSELSDIRYMYQGCSNLKQASKMLYDNLTNISTLFSGCVNLEEVPEFGNTSEVTNMANLFRDCAKIKSVPYFNTPIVQYMQNFIRGCTLLTDFPYLNIPSVTNLSSFVMDTPNLTDTSLNNILKMCISARNMSGSNKTLSYMGFTETNYPATRIQSLPDYENFINAGWTIGY